MTMKRILPIILAVSGLLFAFFVAYFPVYAQTDPNSGLSASQLENVDNRWVIDPEVTSIGKNASRSGLLLDWALRDYNWSYVSPGSVNPLLPFWVTLRNFVYSFMIVVVVAAAIVMLVTRGRSLTIQRFIPRFIVVAILVTFSFSLVQVLYELIDIFQGFFVRPSGVPISQRDLLFIGWNYDPFIGLRLLGDQNFEAAFTTLLFVKLTTFTYYVMVGMLLIRKVILWFFIIISPFFPLLLFFYPLRNTAKIWIGEFFRWLLYAPLFAIFLAALVAMWRTGIPLSFNFGSVNTASAIIFPTAVSILLGGPGQAVGQLNNLNIIDTYAQYLVALMMLWGVIIVPWILLQIFLDYVSNFNVQNAPFYKNFSKYLSRPPIAPAPSTPPNQPIPPGGGAGRERSIPLIKDFKIPTITGLARPIPTSTSMSAQQITKMSIPTLRDIARYESNAITNSEKTKEEARQVRETLTKIANPANISTQTERSEFERMRETLSNQSLKGDKLATSLLQAANSYSQSQNTVNSKNQSVTTIINELANPQIVTNSVEKERIEKIRETIRTESGGSNPLANALSQMTSSTTSISDVLSSILSNTKESQTIRERVEKESREGNTLATTILSSIQSMRNSDRVFETLMNIHEPGRIENSLSRQEYKHVSEMISSEKEKGSEFATHLTERLEKLSTETRIEEKEKIISEIRESVIREKEAGNPLAGLILNQAKQLAEKREDTSISSLRDQFDKEIKAGNPLAVELASLATKKELTDEEVKGLEEKVNQAKQQGDPLGVLLADLLARRQQALSEENTEKQAQAALPKVNRIQQVSLDDYEAVKKMWTENYENLEVPGVEGASARSAWIKDDIKQITETIDLLTSSDPEQVKAGMDKVSDILPFLLIGGFSEGEITSYLKAKLEAAKGVLSQVEKTVSQEDTEVFVKTKPQEAPKHMNVSQKASMPIPEVHSVDPVRTPAQSATQSFGQLQQTNESLLRLANITMPNLKRVAQFDRMLVSKEESKNPDIVLVEETLKGIANPEKTNDATKRDYYTNIREKLLSQSQEGNVSATSLLQATDAVSAGGITNQLQEYSQSMALLTSLHSGNIENSDVKKLKDRIAFDASRGSEFAKQLSEAIINDSFSSDPLQKAALFSQIEQAKQDGDALAESFVTVSKLVNTVELSEYSTRLGRVYELMRSCISPSGDVTSKPNSIAQKLVTLSASSSPSLFKLIEESKKHGLDTTSVVQAEYILSSQKELLTQMPDLASYLTNTQSAPISHVLSEVSDRSVGTLKNANLKTLQASIENSTEDPFVTKLREWGKTLSKAQLEAIEKLLVDINTKNVYAANPSLQALREELEREQDTSTFAKAFLSLSEGFSKGNITEDQVRELMPTFVEKVGVEVRNGSQLAVQVQSLIAKRLEEKNAVSVFHTLLTALSDPSHVSQDLKESIMNLRTLLISEKGKGNKLAGSMTEMISKVIGGSVPKEDDVLTALYEELLLQKQQQNSLAVAFVSEIEKQRESITLLDLGNVLENLSKLDRLPEIERSLYSTLYESLKKAAANSDATAMSILSAVEIVKNQGLDLSEARKIREQLKGNQMEYSAYLSHLLQTSVLTRSALETLEKIVKGFDKKDPLYNEVAQHMGQGGEVSTTFVSTARVLNSEQTFEKRQESLRILLDLLLRSSANNPFANVVLCKLQEERIHILEKGFMTMLKSLSSPETIQIEDEKVQIQDLLKILHSATPSDDFAYIIKGIVAILKKDTSKDIHGSILPLVRMFVKNEAQGGNVTASHILSKLDMTNTKPSEDEMRTVVMKEAENGNAVAQSIVQIVAEKSSITPVSSFPTKNRLQQVSLEDYESVKRMWIEGYRQLEAPGSRTRSEWLSDEMARIDETISLLTSSVESEKQKGMQAVSHILPFLLIGGFTEVEVVSYLKAKLEAARTVSNELHEASDESIKVPAELTKNTPLEKRKEIDIKE